MLDVKKHITEKGKVYKFACPMCSKMIESLYLGQVEFNAYAHMTMHDGKEKKEVVEDGELRH